MKYKEIEKIIDENVTAEGKVEKQMFEVGQYIIYKNGDRLEIGQIKEIRPDRTARVYYHSGSTAALTDFDLMLPIINSFVIKETSLGGEDNVQA